MTTDYITQRCLLLVNLESLNKERKACRDVAGLFYIAMQIKRIKKLLEINDL